MDRILDFIERHKYGILITLVIHVAVFLYFQIATYKEAILFDPWDFRTFNQEAPDNIEITEDQIITPEELFLFQEQEKVTSFVKDENDPRERSNEDNIKYTSYSQGGNPNQIEDDYEQQIKDEIQRQKEKDSKGQEAGETALEDNKKKEQNQDKKQGSAASEKAVGGATLVSFSLKDRHPLNHNDWYIRNPGYTCGNVNGVVKVKITVDEGGDVVNAIVLEEQSQNATPCMRQKAKEYALMSRFNYDAKAEKRQEGTITYRFIYKE